MHPHHIDENVLLDFHQGHLSQGQTLVMACHLQMCADCHALIHLFDTIGASYLEHGESLSLSEEALDLALARIERPEPVETIAVLPAFLQGFKLPPRLSQARIKPRYWAAPGVWMAPIDTGGVGKTYLMNVKRGMNMPLHDHRDTEMTLVLKGKIADYGGEFKPGDLCIRQAGDHHSPSIGEDEDCLCLISSSAAIIPKTLLGKCLQPFARI